MPVYLLTAHAYRSWREDHPRGYVQHGGGLQESNPNLAHWRNAAARFHPVRFTLAQQTVVQEICQAIAVERGARAHSLATCPTHVHMLVSFGKPSCTCGNLKHCKRACYARRHAERLSARWKQKMGQRLARDAGVFGRPWFSRGWDLTPVRQRTHFDYPIGEYLPDHEQTQGGLFHLYDAS